MGESQQVCSMGTLISLMRCKFTYLPMVCSNCSFARLAWLKDNELRVILVFSIFLFTESFYALRMIEQDIQEMQNAGVVDYREPDNDAEALLESEDF